MTSRHKNSSHGKFSKKQKKASRTMMMMRRGFSKPKETVSMPELKNYSLIASIVPFLIRGRRGWL